MRILIIANHYPTCSARYYADAFTRLGHDVRHIGTPMGSFIWGMTVPEHYIWTPDILDPDWTPDLIIAADSDPAVLDAVGELAYPAPKIVVGVDNHVRSYVRPYFDHYFLAHRAVSIQPYDAITTHLPCAYDPVHFYPPDTSSIPPDSVSAFVPPLHMWATAGSPAMLERGLGDWLSRPYDAALVGVPYPQRVEVVHQLRAAGLSVYAATGHLYDDYRAAYHNARISLCVSVCGDVAQRLFETAALGCAVISDNCPDFADLNPQGITIVNTVDEYVSAARDLLAHPERAVANIAQSVAWVSPHTWDTRAQSILSGLR